MTDDLASQRDLLLGRLKQLQTRYPALLRDVYASELIVTIEFYLVDVAIVATQFLLESGITAVHRLDLPLRVCVQMPSLFAQSQCLLVPRVLDYFPVCPTWREITWQQGADTAATGAT